jgi:hypothetical protein
MIGGVESGDQVIEQLAGVVLQAVKVVPAAMAGKRVFEHVPHTFDQLQVRGGRGERHDRDAIDVAPKPGSDELARVRASMVPDQGEVLSRRLVRDILQKGDKTEIGGAVGHHVDDVSHRIPKRSEHRDTGVGTRAGTVSCMPERCHTFASPGLGWTCVASREQRMDSAGPPLCEALRA